jgi:hypothetical protein
VYSESEDTHNFADKAIWNVAKRKPAKKMVLVMATGSG